MVEVSFGTCPRCAGALKPADLRPLGLFKISILQCEWFDRECEYRRWIWGRELREVRAKFDSANNPPTTDLDVVRTAALLIRHHGDDAEAEAARRTDDMIEIGDPKGEAVWRRISATLATMRSSKPPSSSLH